MYRDWCREQNVTVIPARQVHREPLDDIIGRALEVAADGTEAIWITLDIDALDAAYAPGTNAPPVGGLTSPQVLEMVYQFGQHPKVRGYDVMEVSPYLEPNHGITPHVAAATILNFFAARQVASRGSA